MQVTFYAHCNIGRTRKCVTLDLHTGAVLARKILGDHGPRDKGEKGGLRVKPPENSFALRKCPFLAQRLATYTQKAVKMK